MSSILSLGHAERDWDEIVEHCVENSKRHESARPNQNADIVENWRKCGRKCFNDDSCDFATFLKVGAGRRGKCILHGQNQNVNDLKSHGGGKVIKMSSGGCRQLIRQKLNEEGNDEQQVAVAAAVPATTTTRTCTREVKHDKRLRSLRDAEDKPGANNANQCATMCEEDGACKVAMYREGNQGKSCKFSYVQFDSSDLRNRQGNAQVSKVIILNCQEVVQAVPQGVSATAPDAYEYVGCFRDRQNRALSVAHVYDRQDLTIERCYNFCMAKSTKYFAVQNGYYCSCGNENPHPYGGSDRCEVKCDGDANKICGGPWSNSLYEIKTEAELTPTTAVLTPTTAAEEELTGCDRCGANSYCRTRASGRKMCICNKGFFGDGITCTRGSQCIAWGDPHYHTNDGLVLDYMGVCKYLVSGSTFTVNGCSFRVECKNEQLNRRRKVVSYTRMCDFYPEFNYGGQPQSPVIRLQKGPRMLIDGVYGIPAGNTPGMMYYTDASSFMVANATECGVSVGYDGIDTVRISTDERWTGKTTGLCGNNDGNKNNDYTLLDGTDVRGEKNKLALMGESFMVLDDSDVPVEMRCPPDIEVEIPEEDPVYECSAEMDALMASDHTQKMDWLFLPKYWSKTTNPVGNNVDNQLIGRNLPICIGKIFYQYIGRK